MCIELPYLIAMFLETLLGGSLITIIVIKVIAKNNPQSQDTVKVGSWIIAVIVLIINLCILGYTIIRGDMYSGITPLTICLISVLYMAIGPQPRILQEKKGEMQ